MKKALSLVRQHGDHVYETFSILGKHFAHNRISRCERHTRTLTQGEKKRGVIGSLRTWPKFFSENRFWRTTKTPWRKCLENCRTFVVRSLVSSLARAGKQWFFDAKCQAVAGLEGEFLCSRFCSENTERRVHITSGNNTWKNVILPQCHPSLSW